MADKPKVNLPAQKAKSPPPASKPATQPSDVVPFAAKPPKSAPIANPAEPLSILEAGTKDKPLPKVLAASPSVEKQARVAVPAVQTVAETATKSAPVAAAAKTTAAEPARKIDAAKAEAKATVVDPVAKPAVQPFAAAPAIDSAAKAAAVESVAKAPAVEPAAITLALELAAKTGSAELADETSAVEPTANTAPLVIAPHIPEGKATVTEIYTAIDNNAQNLTAKVATGVKSALEKGSKGIQELVEFSKGNLEAAVASSRIAANGVQEMATHAATYSRTSIEQTKATAQQFAAVKSPAEFFQLQSNLIKSSLEAFTGEAAKFGENYVKLLGEMARPLQARYELAVEKVKTPVAA